MDAMDRAILDELKANGRATASEIGRRVSLSVPAVSERMRRLEESGIILGYAAMLDRALLGYGITAFIFVSIGSDDFVDDFRQAAIRQPAVLECHHMAGEYDYLLKVAAADMRALEHFLRHVLKRIPGVAKTNTMLSLCCLKESVNP